MNSSGRYQACNPLSHMGERRGCVSGLDVKEGSSEENERVFED
jgi:hypothetical protein